MKGAERERGGLVGVRVELVEDLGEAEPGLPGDAGAPDTRALFLFPSPADVPDHRDVAGQRAALARAFAGAGWRVPELLAALPDASDLYFDAMSQVRMDRWSAGRIGLVGDAAYGASPASGQGTSLGLVGAYVLASALAEAEGGPAAGFAAYERQMRPFVAENQQLAERNLRGMVLGSAAQIRFQTLMLRLMPRLPGRERMIRRVTEPMRKAATAITLPDVPARVA